MLSSLWMELADRYPAEPELELEQEENVDGLRSETEEKQEKSVEKKFVVKFEDSEKGLLEDRSKVDAATRDVIIDDEEQVIVMEDDKFHVQCWAEPVRRRLSSSEVNNGSENTEGTSTVLTEDGGKSSGKIVGDDNDPYKETENLNYIREEMEKSKFITEEEKTANNNCEVDGVTTTWFPQLPSLDEWDRLLGLCDCVHAILFEEMFFRRKLNLFVLGLNLNVVLTTSLI